MRRPDAGFATISTAILLAIVLAFSFVMVDTTLSGRRTGQSLQNTVSAGQLAEAGVQKALFCLNGTASASCGGTSGVSYAGETNVAIAGGTFTTVLSGSGSSRTITSTGTTTGGRSRTIKVDLTSIPPTDDPGFSYALQAGEGGAHLENNAQVSGTIYANGDIDCKSINARVTGDAFSAKDGGKIQSCKVDFDAHADKVLLSLVNGDAFFETLPLDILGTVVLGDMYSGQTTPAVAPMPDVDLDFWRDSAEAGGTIYGDYSPADNSTLGPVKIEGDLIMDNNVDVIVQGPIWVEGDINAGNNVSFSLDPSFGAFSTTILADDAANQATKGRIIITNNTSINGSGSATSHILFLSTNSSTSDTVPAITVSNNADGAVFYATNGTLRLENNAGAKSLAGYRLFLDENSLVTYVESDFTGQFSNSPAGIWRTQEGTWREIP